MQTELPILSVVLGTFNRLPYLQSTIKNIIGQNIEIPYEIIVIDGGSTDGTKEWLIKQKHILTIIQNNRDQNNQPKKSWGYFMNLGFKSAQGKYILMVSDDCLLIPNSVMNGINFFEERLAQGTNIGGAAFYWREWPIEDKYHINLPLNWGINVNHGLYLKEAIIDVGWIEEESYHFYCADNDLSCKIIQAGYTIEPCPTAIVEHYAHANLGVRAANNPYREIDANTFFEKWDYIIQQTGHKYTTYKYLDYDDPNETYKDFPDTSISTTSTPSPKSLNPFNLIKKFIRKIIKHKYLITNIKKKLNLDYYLIKSQILIDSIYIKFKNYYGKLLKKPRILIYTDSRGQDLKKLRYKIKKMLPFYAKPLMAHFYIEWHTCPEKHTTILDFLNLYNRSAKDYYLIILHAGIVDFSPRCQSDAVQIYELKKEIFANIFSEKEVTNYLNSTLGTKYLNEETINLYSKQMAEKYLIPMLLKIPNLLWIGCNNFVKGWEGNYFRERPKNISLVEDYSTLFHNKLPWTINISKWSDQEVKQFTTDNLHLTKSGGIELLKKIEIAIKKTL